MVFGHWCKIIFQVINYLYFCFFNRVQFCILLHWSASKMFLGVSYAFLIGICLLNPNQASKLLNQLQFSRYRSKRLYIITALNVVPRRHVICGAPKFSSHFKVKYLLDVVYIHFKLIFECCFDVNYIICFYICTVVTWMSLIPSFTDGGDRPWMAEAALRQQSLLNRR